MDLATAFRWTVDRCPDQRAVGGARPMTYREWDARTNQLARVLLDLGVRAGDRLALSVAGGEPLASLHIAAQKLGAVSVPLSTRYAPDETQYCLTDSGAALLVSDAETAGSLPADLACPQHDSTEIARKASEYPDGRLPRNPAETDISVMLYTSGTTGRPKGVPRTHRAEHAAAVAHVIQTQQRIGEAALGVMPLFHTMGLRTLLATFLVGGTWVPQERFDAAKTLELVRDEHVSSLYLVPTMYWALAQAGGLPGATSVTGVAYAGAAMAPALTEQLTRELRPQVFVNHFGSTEVYTFTVRPDAGSKPGCAGRAGVFSNVRLIDPGQGASPQDEVGPGRQGQVIVSLDSPEAFSGYWNRPDADAKAIHDGWYYTGDLAIADDEGELWVSGRVDDMINSGGENIYPDEIEAALSRCPAVAEICVAGLPDERWGSVVTAFVVPARHVAAADAMAEVSAHARRTLPALKQPKRVIPVSGIPKSAVGKVLRRVLADGQYERLASPGERTARA